jgi:hypothetical protein
MDLKTDKDVKIVTEIMQTASADSFIYKKQVVEICENDENKAIKLLGMLINNNYLKSSQNNDIVYYITDKGKGAVKFNTFKDLYLQNIENKDRQKIIDDNNKKQNSKFKGDKIISIATLIIAILTLVLMTLTFFKK